jgi:hypothetical protein
MRGPFATLAVNSRFRHNIRIIWVSAANGDRLGFEVYVSVATSGVGAGIDDNRIAVVGIVNCGLDCIEIGCAIVIDGDYSRLRDRA